MDPDVAVVDFPAKTSTLAEERKTTADRKCSIAEDEQQLREGEGGGEVSHDSETFEASAEGEGEDYQEDVRKAREKPIMFTMENFLCSQSVLCLDNRQGDHDLKQYSAG